MAPLKYMKPDGTYVSNGWLQLDDKKYYMDENGVKLTDTITPDGYYVNINGEKTSYMPGWFKDGDNWRYILKKWILCSKRLASRSCDTEILLF